MYTYIDLGDTVYIGPLDPNKQKTEDYKWNNDYYNKLLANRQYNDAVEYASRYQFKDYNKQNKYLATIAALGSEGRLYEAVQNRAKTPEQKQALDFADNVFVPGGLETIIKDENGQYKDNEIYNRFVEAKQHIGAFIDKDYKYGNSPKKLSFVFPTNVDLSEYGDDSFNYFLNQMNTTKDELISSGIDIKVNKQGESVLTMDVDNDLSNKVLYYVAKQYYSPKKTDIWDSLFGYKNPNIKITSYDENNVEISRNKTAITEYSEVDVDYANLKYYADIIDNAKKAKDEIYEEVTKDNVYSSIKGTPIFDGKDELDNQLKQGIITASEYNNRLTEMTKNVLTFAETDYEHDIYTNYYDSTSSNPDRTMELVDADKRNGLLNHLSSIDDDRKHIYSGYVDGQYGVWIDVDAREGSTQKAEQGAFSVFIPGLLHNEAQQKINQDTKARSMIITDDLTNYKSSYTTQDGHIIKGTDGGRLLVNGAPAERETAEAIINKDIIIRDASNQLISQHLNQNGEIINKAGFENIAKRAAIQGADELYPGTLIKEDGTPMTIDEMNELLFSEDSPFYSKEKAEMLAKLGEKFSYQNFIKINAMLDIYWTIMGNLANFPVKQ